MKTFKVTFLDGNVLFTSMNASLTEAQRYYINQYFQFGDTEEHPKDRLVKATIVEEVQS